MYISPLEQLERLSAETGVSLRDACAAEEIALTTLWRWQKGQVEPRSGTARKLAARMVSIAEDRQKPTRRKTIAEARA